MAENLTDLELADVMPDAPFGEAHRRIVDHPIDRVWPAALAVTPREVRTLGPLLALRGLPARLRGRLRAGTGAQRSMIDEFVAEGFVLLRRDAVARNGRAVVLFGAAGRFWSPTGNAPVPFGDPEAFLAFDEPGYAKTVARLEAIAEGGQTRLETETRVVGTDRASTRRFAPYWALIRGPSGLIRRSWLAAIDRRVRR